MFQATSDRLNGVADISSLQCNDRDENLDQAVGMIDEDPSSMIANLMADHTFYSNRGVENDAFEDSRVYIDLSEDTPDEIDEALNNSVHVSKENGLSDAGTKHLERIFRKHRSVFD